MLDLRLLGGLSAYREGQRLAGRAAQRKRLALLALLASPRGRAVPRDKLLALLWPEMDAARSRHQLTTSTYDLRRVLGEDAIVSTSDGLLLNPECVRCDVWDFERLCAENQRERATDLYVGPFLDGFYVPDAAEFERWAESERARLADRHAAILDGLARAAEAAGDPTQAREWWRRLARQEPYSSRAALGLMQTLAALGDTGAALRHAAYHCSRLRDDLGLDQDAEVEALAARLKAAPRPGPIGAPARPLTGAPSLDEPASAEPAAARATEPGPHPGTARLRRPPPVPRRRRARVAGVVAVGPLLVGVAIAGTLASGRDGIRNAAPALAEPLPGAVLRVPAADAPAHEDPAVLVSRARVAWNLRTKPGLDEAVVLFRRATERDPGYAPAHAGLAESYAMLGFLGLAPAEAMFPKARAAALRALELDPGLGGAHAALGQALAWEHAWSDAEEVYRRALEVAPDYATAHQWYALLLAYLGRADEAALHTGHASTLDPLSIQINNMHGMMLYYAGDLDAAMRQYERTVDAEPDSAWVRRNPWVLANYGRVAAAAARPRQAILLIERALEIVPTHPRPLLDLAYAHLRAGDRRAALAAFARADPAHEHYPVYRAWLHVLLGELDEAFAWLDRVDPWPLATLGDLNADPRYAALRADPRYQAIRSRLGMPAR